MAPSSLKFRRFTLRFPVKVATHVPSSSVAFASSSESVSFPAWCTSTLVKAIQISSNSSVGASRTYVVVLAVPETLPSTAGLPPRMSPSSPAASSSTMICPMTGLKRYPWLPWSTMLRLRSRSAVTRVVSPAVTCHARVSRSSSLVRVKFTRDPASASMP